MRASLDIKTARSTAPEKTLSETALFEAALFEAASFEVAQSERVQPEPARSARRLFVPLILAIHLTGILFCSATGEEKTTPTETAPAQIPSQSNPETESPPHSEPAPVPTPKSNPNIPSSEPAAGSTSGPDTNKGPGTETETDSDPAPEPARPSEKKTTPDPDSASSASPNRGGRGLMSFHDTFPLAILHLQTPVNALHDFEEGDLVLHAAFDWGNSFGLQPTSLAATNIFTVDTEVHRLELSFWYAIHKALYLGGEMAIQSRSAGVLDGFIDGFHDAFGLDDGGRRLVSKDQYDLVFQDQGRRSLKSGAGFGDVVLKAHANVYDGNAFLPAIALQGLVGLPSSTSGFGSDGVDFGINIAAAKTLAGVLHLHGTAGTVYFTDPDVADLDYEHAVSQFAGGLELELGSKVSVVAQILYQSALMKEARPLDEGRTYVGGGIKWEIVPDTIVELGILENLSPFKNTADVSLLLALEFKL
jgi:catechol 2,3-dioxygenase-like lactoylglutathione lyase family enzyme